MSDKHCIHFETCNAPLCPDDLESLEHCAWFVDEDICKCVPAPTFVKRQKFLVRKSLDVESAGCFTVKMLEQRVRAHSSFAGIDPSKGPPHTQEAVWLQKRPERPKHPVSKAFLQANRARKAVL